MLQSGGQPRPQLLLLGDLPGVWLQLWRLLLQQVHLLLGRPHLLRDLLPGPAALLLRGQRVLFPVLGRRPLHVHAVPLPRAVSSEWRLLWLLHEDRRGHGHDHSCCTTASRCAAAAAGDGCAAAATAGSRHEPARRVQPRRGTGPAATAPGTGPAATAPGCSGESSIRKLHGTDVFGPASSAARPTP